MSMRSVSAMGGSAARAGASGAAGGAMARRCVSQAAEPAPPASARKGSIGIPGSTAIIAAAPAAIASGFDCAPSCPIITSSAVPSVLPLVTTMPAATETSSAGIWLTRPSPTVRTEKVCAASPMDMPCRATPIAMPPTRLMKVMISPAIASPRTNFAAPSIAP